MIVQCVKIMPVPLVVSFLTLSPPLSMGEAVDAYEPAARIAPSASWRSRLDWNGPRTITGSTPQASVVGHHCIETLPPYVMPRDRPQKRKAILSQLNLMLETVRNTEIVAWFGAADAQTMRKSFAGHCKGGGAIEDPTDRLNSIRPNPRRNDG
jgi:hypothetical protein